MRARTAVVALDHDPSAGSERLRPPGEEAPLWLAPTLAALGIALSVWVSAEIFGERDPVPPVVVEAHPSAAGSGEASAVPASSAVSAPSSPSVITAPVAGPAASGEGEGQSPAASGGSAPVAVTPPATIDSSASAARPVDVAPSRAAEAAPAAPVASAPVPVAVPCLPVIGVPFTHDSTKPITDGLEPAVRPLVGWLADHPSAVLSVEGHADTIGTEDYNIVLSFGRARATIAWLVRLGAAPSQLAPRAAGTSAPKTLPSGMASNRLVILQIEGVEACRDLGGAAKKP